MTLRQGAAATACGLTSKGICTLRPGYWRRAETTKPPTFPRESISFSPDGRLLGRIPIYEDVLTNLAFGGSDGRTIYITAGKTVIKTRVDVPGQVAYPRWQKA